MTRLSLSNVSRTLTTAADRLDNLAEYPTLKQNFDQTRDALEAAAKAKGLPSPFAGNATREELSGTDELFTYLNAELTLEAAERDRNALLKGAAVTAGAAIGGLALRGAYRRGWGDRAVRKLTAAVLSRRYGTLAGQAYQLIRDGRVTTILDEKTGVSFDGDCQLIKEGVAFTTDDGGQRLAFSLDAVTGIEIALDHQGNIRYAILDLVDYTTLDETEER